MVHTSGDLSILMFTAWENEPWWQIFLGRLITIYTQFYYKYHD